jgi:hypothetical protein
LLEYAMKSVHIAAFVLASLVAVPPRVSAGPGDAKVSANAEAGAVPPPHRVTPPSSAGAPSAAGSQLGDSPEATESTAIWKQWPLWAVVGGVVAGSVVLYAATRDGGLCGGGCTEIDFR